MIVSELATELTLKTLLIELTRDGVTYARCYQSDAEKNLQRSSMLHYDKLCAVSNILASILPGICPAKVQQGFKDYAATDVFPYGHIGMEDVERLLAFIDAAWKEESHGSTKVQAV
jgi:hypothetical protein